MRDGRAVGHRGSSANSDLDIRHTRMKITPYMGHDTRISLIPCMHLSHLPAGMPSQVVTTSHNIDASMITHDRNEA